MTTAQASDWLDAGALREELRLAAGGEHDPMLARHISAAVRWVERATGLLLLERSLVLSLSPVPAHSPIPLDGVRALAEVSQVDYWTAPPFSPPPDHELARAKPGGEVGDVEPDVGALQELGGDDWRLWPRGAGWPEDAARFQVTLKQGLDPAEHEDLSQALVMVARAFYDGEASPDQGRLIDRTVAPYATTAYQPFTLGAQA